MRTLAITTLLAVFASWASAQRIGAVPAHVSANHPPASPNSAKSRPALSSNLALLRGLHHSGNRQSPFYPYGIVSDLFYPDNNNPPPESSQPLQPELLMQALSGLTALSGQAAAQPPAQSDARSQLIELRGDRYVSLTSAKADNASEPTMILKNESAETSRARELPPVMLLFRDGHQEDIRDYTIADGVIYARGNFYRDGYWNKKIELSALDLPRTVKSNEARGVRFVLPTSPNEVITRP